MFQEITFPYSLHEASVTLISNSDKAITTKLQTDISNDSDAKIFIRYVQIITSAGKDVGKQEPSRVTLENVKWCRHFEKELGTFFIS